MEKKHNQSLYHIISEAVCDGELPGQFSLPDEKPDNQISWADGAWDGVNIYHMGFSRVEEESQALMIKAVHAAAARNMEEADRLFCDLGQKSSALVMIDELQSYIIDHKEELSAENLYDYAVHAVMDSSDRECVKFGLSLLELFNMDHDEKLKNVIRTLGLSDEFSLFAIFVMLRWQEANNEVYQLAKRIHGWGRIHAIERIEPETEEIRDWLLKEGVHNAVLPAYSALVCWQKSGAEEVLKRGPSREEFSGIRDIIGGLLDEGPILGISKIPGSADRLTEFLNQAGNWELDLADYEVIRRIRLRYESENSKDASIVSLCRGILDSDNCRKTVRDAVKEGRGVGLAEDLRLEYKADIWNVLKTDFEEKYYLCGYLMRDAEYKEETLRIFRERLPLEEMKTSPTDSIGFGQKYKLQLQLESIVQQLHRYPLEGVEFVETALQSEPVTTRNCGMGALEAWVSAKKTPLLELMPDMYHLLCRLCEVEVDENVKKRMKGLLEGNTIA
jgi:hypothetical protein